MECWHGKYNEYFQKGSRKNGATKQVDRRKLLIMSFNFLLIFEEILVFETDGMDPHYLLGSLATSWWATAVTRLLLSMTRHFLTEILGRYP